MITDQMLTMVYRIMRINLDLIVAVVRTCKLRTTSNKKLSKHFLLCRSSNVEAVLESERENTQIYNNVARNHHLHISPPSPRFAQQQQQKNLSQQQQQQQHQQNQPPKVLAPSLNRNYPKIPEIRTPAQNQMMKHPDLPLKPQKPQLPQQQQHHHQETKTKNESVVSILRKFDVGPKSLTPFHNSSSTATTGGQLSCMKECDIEKFAQDNLNLHAKGIFRKKVLIIVM